MRLPRFVSVLVPSHPRYGTEIEEKNVRGEGRPRFHRATAKSGAGRRGARALACLLAVAGLFTASALGATTHPFQSEFTGSDTRPAR